MSVKFFKNFIPFKLVQYFRYIVYLFLNFPTNISGMLGLVKNKRRILFVAAIPKSGSTWVEKFMSSLPNCLIRPINGSPKIISEQNLPKNSFNCFPKFGFSTVKTHINPNLSNFNVLSANDINKILVIYRDPRDCAISRYYHLLRYPKKNHEIHAKPNYQKISKNEAIDHSINIVIKENIPWISGWFDYAKENPNNCLLISYEDLYDSPVDQFYKICKFYSFPIKKNKVKHIVSSLDERRGNLNDLGKNHKLGEGSTFRKGGHGIWRKEFSEDQKKYFYEHAEKDLLRFGYKN